MSSLSVAHLVGLVVIVLMLPLACMWCVSYKKLLARFDKKNQKFSPNLAFLLLIPIIGIFWWSYLAFYVKNNLKKMNEKIPVENYNDGGFAFAILSSVSYFLAGTIPNSYAFFAITTFVLWFFSWIKIVKARKLFRDRFFINM